MEYVGTVLGVSTEQPPKYRRCSSVFRDVHGFVIATFYWSLPSPGVDGRMDDWLKHIRGNRSGGGDIIYVGAISFVLKPL